MRSGLARDAVSEHPGQRGNPTAAYPLDARGQMNADLWLTAGCMAGAPLARRYGRVGAETAEHESQNEDPARRLGKGVVSQPFRGFVERAGSRLHEGVRYPSTRTHRDDPFIGYLMYRSAEPPKEETTPLSGSGCGILLDLQAFLGRSWSVNGAHIAATCPRGTERAAAVQFGMRESAVRYSSLSI
jgi:hypothetical protein